MLKIIGILKFKVSN